MASDFLIERASRHFTVHQDGYSVETGIDVTVDERGRLHATRAPGDALGLLVLDTSATPLDLANRLRGGGPMGRHLVERRLLVVLTDQRREVQGFVLPDVVAAIVREVAMGVRGDSELLGPAEGPAGSSTVRCPHCARAGRYDDVEPGETRCRSCDGVLRPA